MTQNYMDFGDYLEQKEEGTPALQGGQDFPKEVKHVMMEELKDACVSVRDSHIRTIKRNEKKKAMKRKADFEENSPLVSEEAEGTLVEDHPYNASGDDEEETPTPRARIAATGNSNWSVGCTTAPPSPDPVILHPAAYVPKKTKQTSMCKSISLPHACLLG